MEDMILAIAICTILLWVGYMIHREQIKDLEERVKRLENND